MQDDDLPPLQDSPKGNWVSRYAPSASRKYLHLMRMDRTIGVWLLLWPCWWSIALASQIQDPWLPDPALLLLFAFGSLVMRSAGCIYNDIVDRDIDAAVTRTRNRPIPSGQISILQASVLAFLICLIGFLILVNLNALTISIGFLVVPFILIYPFMKRITWWPQLFLGITFNSGALLGWTAVTNQVNLPALVLYFGCIFWTLGYDTIYAHQDKKDDARINVGSTARYFSESTKIWVSFFYTAAVALILISGILCGVEFPFLLAVVTASIYAGWHLYQCDLHSPEQCLTAFRSSHKFGAMIFLGILSSSLWKYYALPSIP